MFNHDAEVVGRLIVFSGHVQHGGIPGVEPELSGGITDLICTPRDPPGGAGTRRWLEAHLENPA